MASFVSLPAELRLMIYKYLLPAGEHFAIDSVLERRPPDKRTHTAILRTCKAVYQEAAPPFQATQKIYLFTDGLHVYNSARFAELAYAATIHKLRMRTALLSKQNFLTTVTFDLTGLLTWLIKGTRRYSLHFSRTDPLYLLEEVLAPLADNCPKLRKLKLWYWSSAYTNKLTDLLEVLRVLTGNTLGTHFCCIVRDLVGRFGALETVELGSQTNFGPDGESPEGLFLKQQVTRGFTWLSREIQQRRADREGTAEDIDAVGRRDGREGS